MTCRSFEHEIIEAWPDLSIRPDLKNHLVECERCALAVRRHAMVANCLEGINSPLPSIQLSQRIKAMVRMPKAKARNPWRSRSVLLLIAVAFMGLGDAYRLKPRSLEKRPVPSVATSLTLVNTNAMTEQGSLALSRARAAVEPITQATTSAITRVLYEMTEPLLFIDRS